MSYQDQLLKAIASVTLKIGGSAGNIIKKVAAGIELKNSADTAFVKGFALKADGTSENEIAIWKNIRDANPIALYDFSGGTPPSAGTNTGKHGFCHTSGGAFDAGDIVYDTGSDLEILTVKEGQTLSTKTAITGTVSLDANSLYVAETATAPYTWVKKGDVGATVGTVRDLTLTAGTGASTDSSTSIIAGSDISILLVDLTTSYDNAAVITFSIGALSIGSIDGTDSAVTNQYMFPVMGDVAADNPLNVAISNTPTTGALKAKLLYSADQSN